MFEQTIPTSATPHIVVIEYLGDLIVRGDARPQVTVRLRNGSRDVNLQHEGDTVTISARTDGYITCPLGTTLTIHTVRGDLKLKEVQGAITIGTVYGDVALRTVGPTTLEQTQGDLSVRQVTGDLQAHSVAGDVLIRGVSGAVALQGVGGDLRAEGVAGGLTATGVGADVRLGPPFAPGAVYRVTAGSDLIAYLPADVSLQMTFRSGGQVRSSIPNLPLHESAGETRGVLGAGEATLQAQVGGHVRLRPAEGETATMDELDLDVATEVEGLGAVIEARITEAMAEMEMRLEESLGRVSSDVVRRRVERGAEHARQALEQAAEQARRAAEREAERARLQRERAERRWQRVSGQRPRPRSESVTDEERMRVLRLVEGGKLTPEQAAELLAALEGR